MNEFYNIKTGGLFDANVECFVNSWNTNIIPWFLLLPHGVSGRLKKVAGYKPFNELLRKGIVKPGGAVLTSGGRLNKKVIHVAGVNYFWISTLEIVEKCTRNALILAKDEKLKSIAFPIIGTGVGGLKESDVISVMENVFKEKEWNIDIMLVRKNK